ncbi:MAG TPA: hypothetical protein VGR81_01815 [Candidatus Acidoferrales bacterium]|nr:hypothetical protein [Candidatus Acidoferrales bacterium]
MCRKALAVFCVLILSGLVWASNEPWKTKPYQQWDQHDLDQILNSSPWGKRLIVAASWRPAQFQDMNQSGQSQSEGGAAASAGNQNGATQNQPKGSAMLPNNGRTADTGDQPAEGMIPQTPFYIRWYSSRVMREALVREAVLKGQMSEADGAKFLAEPVTAYEVVLLGPDMTPFQSLTEDQLKSVSYLEGKQSKQKIAPIKIQIQQGANGKTANLIFFFPKKTASGQDVASAQEKGLEFVCKVKGLDLHNTFDTRKMVDEKGQDF